MCGRQRIEPAAMSATPEKGSIAFRHLAVKESFTGTPINPPNILLNMKVGRKQALRAACTETQLREVSSSLLCSNAGLLGICTPCSKEEYVHGVGWPSSLQIICGRIRILDGRVPLHAPVGYFQETEPILESRRLAFTLQAV